MLGPGMLEEDAFDSQPMSSGTTSSCIASRLHNGSYEFATWTERICDTAVKILQG